MAKKQDPSQIYKWLAVTLTLLVAGYILFLVSRQALLAKKLTNLTQQSPLPAVSPSPRSSPRYTTPLGTENWNEYIGRYYKFTVRYPSDMQVKEEGDKVTSFYKAGIRGGGLIEFSVRKLADNLFMDVMPRRQGDAQLVTDLFNSGLGVLRNEKVSANAELTVTKIADLTLNEFPAVYFSRYYKSTPGQDPSSYLNCYLVKVGNSYYLLFESTGDSLTHLKSNESKFKLFASTFTLF